MEGAKYSGMIVGYGATSVEVPERSPFSLADLMVLAYIIEHYSAGEWTRFDYARVCDELWYARVGDRATLRGRLRLLRKYGLIETKTVGVKGVVHAAVGDKFRAVAVAAENTAGIADREGLELHRPGK